MKPKPEATEDQSAQAVDPATPLFEPERPRRRFVLKLSLGADSYEEMTSALYNIAREFDRREIGKDMASGSPSSGFSLEWSEDESVTPKEPEYISPKEKAAYKPPVRQSGAELLEEYKSQQKAKPTTTVASTQGVGTLSSGQRDTSKPEQMTPEEYASSARDPELPKSYVLSDGNGNFITEEKNGWFKVWRLTGTHATLAGTVGFKGAEGLAKAKTRLKEVSAEMHEEKLQDGLRTKRPVSKAAVDAYGITLPAGYVQDGELYVYRPISATVSDCLRALRSDSAANLSAIKSQQKAKHDSRKGRGQRTL